MMTAKRLPKLLTATSALMAVTALLFPKTAVKKRLAVSSFDVLIACLGMAAKYAMFAKK